ncbi:hypothetical protein [Mesonia maritima]|uniref:Polyferredoxin n=1 Tax=Mesonia maritima TaxID=1793873 RepID=A0ABU1K3B7_9FLAO|nr:hypothetical protein [Mesonia maritima]MDR6300099.1 polyferredoxin [Mesonia maritima]
MTLHKVLKYLAIVIGVIGLILLARIVIEGDAAIESSADLQSSMINPLIYLTYAVFVAVIILVLIFVLKDLFTGNVKNTLLSIGVFAIIIFIAYLIPGDTTPVEMNNGEMLSSGGVTLVNMGLRTFYILALIAVGAMVFSGIKKLSK